jgi:hypothetical protein
VVAAPSTLRAVAWSLGADVTTAEAVGALEQRGIPTILLKGPVVAGVLYDRGELRPYSDCDLLVAPGDVAPGDERCAEETLRVLGYAPLVGDSRLKGHRPLHAREWIRADTASVDLHRTLPGAQAEPQAVWDELSRHRRPLRLAGREVDGLDAPGLAVVLSLHVAHHGTKMRKAVADLRRALERLPAAEWQSAVRIATTIGAVGAFAAGLRVLPEGTELAERLCPGARPPSYVLLRAQGSPPLAAGIEWLGQTRGLRAKTSLLARTFVPAPGALRLWRPLARRGRAGLMAAYVTQPFWLAAHAGPSLVAVRRARRAVR